MTHLNDPETKEEYFARLEMAMKNLEEGKGIRMTEEEFDSYFLKLLNETNSDELNTNKAVRPVQE